MSLMKKAVVIGLDSAGSRLTKKYIDEGLLPNMKRIMEKGTYMHALCPFPTLTPSNWTTISTGTWPGTHGITDFYNHHPGEQLDKNRWGSGFDSRECNVDFIWEMAEKEGVGSILINYPASWPARTKKVWQVMGCGLGMENELKLNSGQLFTTEDIPLATQVEFKSASGWKGIDNPKEFMETEIKFEMRGSSEKIYFLLAGPDHVSLHRSKDYCDTLVELERDVWSEWAKDKTVIGEKKVEVAFKLKLMDYDYSKKQVKLFLPEIFPTEGFTEPAELSRELVENVGPFLEEGAYVAYNQQLVGDEEFLSLMEFQDQWYAKTANYLMKNKDWGILYLHAHGIDYANHKYMRFLSRDTYGDKEEYLKRAYKSADKMVGEIYDQVDDDTLFIVVGDHGATSKGLTDVSISESEEDDIDVYKIMKEGGFLSYEEPFPGIREIDWDKTVALPNRTGYIYVNLKGRDPEGIVDPAQYEEVKNKVFHYLRNYREPDTGKSPFSLVLKKEEARVFGLYGDRIGDVVYSMHPEFSSEHGRQHAGAQVGDTSMECLLMLSGRGIKQGYQTESIVFLTDIVPTICSAMNLPIPPKCEGKVIYDALEDPNHNLSQVKKLAKERDVLSRAYNEYRRLTHS